MDYALKRFIDNKDLCPCIDPDFDHSPRSAYRGIILHESTPEKWGKLVNKTCNLLSDKPEEDRLLFIKAWNEWGEGNYLEPDRKWGSAYLYELSKNISVN